jgi:hypothetical protein
MIDGWTARCTPPHFEKMAPLSGDYPPTRRTYYLRKCAPLRGVYELAVFAVGSFRPGIAPELALQYVESMDSQ